MGFQVAFESEIVFAQSNVGTCTHQLDISLLIPCTNSLTKSTVVLSGSGWLQCGRECQSSSKDGTSDFINGMPVGNWNIKI